MASHLQMVSWCWMIYFSSVFSSSLRCWEDDCFQTCKVCEESAWLALECTFGKR